MLLDDRRIVLTLEAICWCTAAMVFFQQTDFPRAMAILPLLMGVLMALPIPFPGTNTFPAWAIVFLATAQAEQDGILVLWGYASILATCIWFGVFGTLMWTLTMASFEYIGRWF